MACSIRKLKEQSRKFLIGAGRSRDSEDDETLPFFGIPYNYFSRTLFSGGTSQPSSVLRGGLLPNESRVKPIVWERGEHVTSDQCCYILKRYLGAGSYGMVVKAWNTTEGTLVALKFFHRLQHSSKERQEVAILKKLAKEELDEYFAVGRDIFRYKAYTVVAMDLMSADLHTAYFQKHLSPRMIRPIAQQIFAALIELARLGIIHGDLKPMNIMLVNLKSMRVKIIDYSCSTQTKVTKNHQPDMNVQTRFFRAPEIIIGSSCTPQIDMWSFAHTLVVLYTGSTMFRGANSYYMMRYFIKMFGPPDQELIESGKHRTNNFLRGTDGLWRLKKREEMKATYPTFVHREDPSLPKSVYEIGTTSIAENVDYYWRHGPDLQAAIIDSTGLADLLSKMFVYDPEKRISPQDALKHPFITMSNITDPEHTSTSYHNGARNMMIQTCTAFTRDLHPEWFEQAKAEADVENAKSDSTKKPGEQEGGTNPLEKGAEPKKGIGAKKRDSKDIDAGSKAGTDAKKKRSDTDVKPESEAQNKGGKGANASPKEGYSKKTMEPNGAEVASKDKEDGEQKAEGKKQGNAESKEGEDGRTGDGNDPGIDQEAAREEEHNDGEDPNKEAEGGRETKITDDNNDDS